MQFLKSLFHFDRGASAMEKFVTVIVPLFVLALLVILFGSCLQIFHNGISAAAATASGGQHVIGGLLLVLAGFWAWLNWSDRVPFQVNETVATILLLVLIIFSALFFTGFYAGQYR